MRVLVAWGSKLGGTEGIAKIIGEVLALEGFDVVVQRASEVAGASAFDAAIVGGALYANRWHRDARRFVSRNVAALRRMPVWMFSSGPLDESADRKELPPANQVAALMERVGASDHVTFGGRLRPDAKGLAGAMAKTHAGDWRNPDRIRAWAKDVARVLPYARPGFAIDPPARSLRRLAVYGVIGWAVCAAVMGALLAIASTGVAVGLHAVAVPLVFTALAVRYFRPRGAREPLWTALAWTLIVAVLDAAVVAGLVLRDFSMFTGFAGTWLPFALVFLSSWLTGFLMSTMPWPRATDRHAPVKA